MKRIRFSAALALLAATACSSHGGAVVPPVAVSGGSAAAQPASGTRAQLSIVVPNPSASSSANRRSPRYVSPSSANLQVAVNGGAPVSYGLTPQSPGCGVVAGNTTCSFTIPAPPGTDSLALTLTDGSGAVLSRNVVSATLATGAATPVDVTLAAVPASVALVPGVNATIDGTRAPYHVPGLFPQPVEVEPLDADGNVIIGPGAPSVSSVSVTTGGAFANVASANTTDPAAFVLKAVDGSAGGQTVTVTATVQGVPLSDGTISGPVSGSTAFTFTPAIAVASGPFVSVVSLESQRALARLSPCGGACFGLTIVSALTTDRKGTVYLSANSFLGLGISSSVGVFAPGSTAPSYALGASQGVHSVTGLTVDTNGNLYVANGSGFRQPPPSIAEFAPGTKTASRTISGVVQPGGIAVDAAGNIYLANQSGSVTVYAPNTSTPLKTLSDPSLGAPYGLALDSSGGLYVGDSLNNDIAYFAPGQSALTATLTDSSFSNNWNAGALMFDPSGNLWVAYTGNTGTSPSIVPIPASSLPNAVTFGTSIVGVGGAMGWIP